MSDDRPEKTTHDVQANFVQRRRDKTVAEIQANRRGEYTVPTWVLTVLLLVIIGTFATLIYFS
jgi:hypothetical protein